MCSNVLNYRTISVSEHGRQFILDNPNQQDVEQVQIDGCLIAQGRRCDYLFAIPHPANVRVMLVELKGSRISDAFEQIEATAQHPSVAKYKQFLREGFVVSSRVPLSGTDIQRLKTRMLRDHGVTVVIKNSRLQLAI